MPPLHGHAGDGDGTVAVPVDPIRTAPPQAAPSLEQSTRPSTCARTEGDRLLDSVRRFVAGEGREARWIEIGRSRFLRKMRRAPGAVRGTDAATLDDLWQDFVAWKLLGASVSAGVTTGVPAGGGPLPLTGLVALSRAPSGGAAIALFDRMATQSLALYRSYTGNVLRRTERILSAPPFVPLSGGGGEGRVGWTRFGLPGTAPVPARPGEVEERAAAILAALGPEVPSVEGSRGEGTRRGRLIDDGRLSRFLEASLRLLDRFVHPREALVLVDRALGLSELDARGTREIGDLPPPAADGSAEDGILAAIDGARPAGDEWRRPWAWDEGGADGGSRARGDAVLVALLWDLETLSPARHATPATRRGELCARAFALRLASAMTKMGAGSPGSTGPLPPPGPFRQEAPARLGVPVSSASERADRFGVRVAAWASAQGDRLDPDVLASAGRRLAALGCLVGRDVGVEEALRRVFSPCD